jgi:hypothetical protein
VELANGARQQFTLYAQTGLFGSRLFVDLVRGEEVLVSQQVSIRSHDALAPMVAVVAERPERILSDVNDALVSRDFGSSTVITLTPADLPPRVEAWAAVDRLIWQDVDAAELSETQLQALKLWIGAGGQLVVLGGTTGSGTIAGFGADLLPFMPTHTVDATSADLAALFGRLSSDAPQTAPALAGTLDHGTVLARSGDDVIAAQGGYGRGTVALVGVDPGQTGLADSDASAALWRRLLPQQSGRISLNPLAVVDDSQILYALQNLPSVDLPPVEQLLILLVAYIALIGPINYLVLRRLDRREWAWVTIPALVAVFAAASYGLGASLKGSDVIVNEIAVVRAAQGTGRGIGQAYLGIYSPSRRTFDVSIPGGALLSNPASLARNGQTEQPLDVIFGESTSRLRGFEVGFGVLRGFRAEAPADAPLIDSNLRLSGGKLQGEIVNRSDRALENVAVLFGGAVAVVQDLAPGETQSISLDTTSVTFWGFAVSERIFGATFPRDPAQARTVSTRRTVIDQLFPYGAAPSTEAPLLLAWRDGPVMDVQLPGDQPNRVGDGLFMIPLGMSLDARQAFGNTLVTQSIVDADAASGWADGTGYTLSRGTMTVEARPSSLSGAFAVASLEVSISQGEFQQLDGDGAPTSPLPDADQPDQDDPVGDGVEPLPSDQPADCFDEPCPDVDLAEPPGKAIGGRENALPAYQLWDRVAERWLEFPHPEPFESYLITDAQRYVDERGALLVRFVNRADPGEFGEDQRYFSLAVRMEGTIE